MKIGLRNRSFSKSLKAMTTGRAKREIKGLVNPLYGAKGVNKIKNPKKYVRDKIYHKTTFGLPGTGLSKSKKKFWK